MTDFDNVQAIFRKSLRSLKRKKTVPQRKYGNNFLGHLRTVHTLASSSPLLKAELVPVRERINSRAREFFAQPETPQPGKA